MTNSSITLIMPVYNGARTLPNAFKSLDQQERKELIDTIIIVDDGSRDTSRSLIEAWIKKGPYNIKPIFHPRSQGLAASYNEAIDQANTPYIATMHQDIILAQEDSFARIVDPLINSSSVVATCPVLIHPKELWLNYNFWQKCFTSRHVLRREVDLTGKFDCFNRIILQKAGCFNEKIYRTAGEDADLKARLKKAKLEYAPSGVKVIHGEEPNPTFNFRNLLHKEAQYAEARGVILRHHGPQGLQAFILNFFREILLIGLFIPYISFLAATLIAIYAFAYTWLVYIQKPINPRVAILPFANLFLLPYNLFFSFRGFISGRQVI